MAANNFAVFSQMAINRTQAKWRRVANNIDRWCRKWGETSPRDLHEISRDMICRPPVSTLLLPLPPRPQSLSVTSSVSSSSAAPASSPTVPFCYFLCLFIIYGFRFDDCYTDASEKPHKGLADMPYTWHWPDGLFRSLHWLVRRG